jgi:hypothetical protein
MAMHDLVIRGATAVDRHDPDPRLSCGVMLVGRPDYLSSLEPGSLEKR